MAYSEDWNDVYERAATIVDRILKGAKPAGIPVELPTKFKLIVNAKTARALRLSIPQSIMIRAYSVID
jgi:putative ABC transport system substrate-binding protein